MGGIDLGTVQTTGLEETLDFVEALKAADEMVTKVWVAKAWAGTSKVPQHAASDPASPLLSPAWPLLSEEIANRIADLEQRQHAPDTITVSRHCLRRLLGVAGDHPVSEIKPAELRAFWDAVRWWRTNASVKPQYRDFSVQEIVEMGRAEGVPVNLPPQPVSGAGVSIDAPTGDNPCMDT